MAVDGGNTFNGKPTKESSRPWGKAFNNNNNNNKEVTRQLMRAEAPSFEKSLYVVETIPLTRVSNVTVAEVVTAATKTNGGEIKNASLPKSCYTNHICCNYRD